MNKAVRLSFLSFLVILVAFTGCARKKKQSKMATMQTQIDTLTNEVVRLDQQIQETRAAIQTQETRQGAPSSTGETSGGTVYRTPSGFELPSANIQKALKKMDDSEIKLEDEEQQ